MLEENLTFLEHEMGFEFEPMDKKGYMVAQNDNFRVSVHKESGTLMITDRVKGIRTLVYLHEEMLNKNYFKI